MKLSVRLHEISALRTTSVAVVAAMAFTVVAPMTALAAAPATTNKDTTVQASEVANALAKTDGVLGSSDQTKTTSDSDSAIKAATAGASVDIPKDASDGVTIGSTDGTTPAIDISLPNAGSAKDATTVAPGTVAYAGNNGSANAVQATEDGGVRMLTVIDNPKAPTAYDYKVTVPNGGSIQLLEDGSAIVLDGQGQPIMAVATPWAKDANGTPIKTYFTTDGQTLTQHIEHRVAGVVYPVTADPYYLGYNMTSAEFSWCKWPSRWSLCTTAGMTLANQALSAANQVASQKRWSIHNGGADAFRHCYWSGLMTQRFGYDTARGFGDRHEDEPSQPASEKNMDLHNNEKGRQWAWASGGLWNRCVSGVNSGELKRLVY